MPLRSLFVAACRFVWVAAAAVLESPAPIAAWALLKYVNACPAVVVPFPMRACSRQLTPPYMSRFSNST